jgi:signal transduction histidine kinase
LFERYFRGANAVGVAGSGVGLHLVAMVLELHGGRIEVHSSLGRGSSFIVHLPVAAEDAVQARLGLGAA